MAKRKVQIAVTKSVKKDYSITITEEEIKKRFRLPDDAEIWFRNEDGTREIEDRLTARWTREK